MKNQTTEYLNQFACQKAQLLVLGSNLVSKKLFLLNHFEFENFKFFKSADWWNKRQNLSVLNYES